MKNNLILYICHTDFRDLSSGSKVRPYKMYRAFLDKGYDVLLINGDIDSRLAAYRRIRRRIADCRFCYIEPSTYPIHPLDYHIYLGVFRQKIPIGIFYRDAYYKFPHWWKVAGPKKYELLLRYRMDWMLFKKVASVIFFPSASMGAMFDFDRKVPLPPGAEEKFIDRPSLFNNAIHVGGINEKYGADLLLESFRAVNREQTLNLNLVCRREDAAFLKYSAADRWLNIHHATGTELKKIYAQSDFAVIPRKRDTYNDLAMPVKLFEYLSYGLPIVSTDCTEMAAFIRKNGVGIVTADHMEGFVRGVREMNRALEKDDKFRANVKEAVTCSNMWTHRVETIVETLDE